MSEKHTPSAGAYRAACQILNRQHLPGWSAEIYAQIIDRETNHGELLEAAKKANRWFGWYYEMGNGQQDEKKQTTWNQLKQAIAKAEGAGNNSPEVRRAREALKGEA